MVNAQDYARDRMGRRGNACRASDFSQPAITECGVCDGRLACAARLKTLDLKG